MINSCYHLLIEDGSLVRRVVACKEYLPILTYILFLIHFYSNIITINQELFKVVLLSNRNLIGSETSLNSLIRA